MIDGKKRYVLDNCVFVKTSGREKNCVPVNISALDKNATYIAENFEKGEKIHLVGVEKLDSIRIKNKTYGICTFTVIKVIDSKIYKAIDGILTALITRIINCSDIVAENILNPELLQRSVDQESDQDTEKENLESADELDDKEDDLNIPDPNEDQVLDEEDTETDQEVDNLRDIDPEEDMKFDNGQEDPEENEEDDWSPAREPSAYYILDFSYIKKEDYHS
jgi:hypothetical protein